MKFAIFIISVVVLLACEETQGLKPALLSGSCKIYDIPAVERTECKWIKCDNDNGEISMSTVACKVRTCPNGPAYESQPADLTQQWPDCCPQYKCPE